MSQSKTTTEVFEDHLQLRLDQQVEQDIQNNFSTEVVLLTSDGQFHGHDGIRQSAELLQQRVPDGQYHYEQKMVHDNMAFLVWSATGRNNQSCHGADSFLIENGKIIVQTIYYKASDGDQ